MCILYLSYLHILRSRTEHAIYKYTATRQTMVSRTLTALRIPLIFHCVNSLGLYPFFKIRRLAFYYRCLRCCEHLNEAHSDYHYIVYSSKVRVPQLVVHDAALSQRFPHSRISLGMTCQTTRM